VLSGSRVHGRGTAAVQARRVRRDRVSMQAAAPDVAGSETSSDGLQTDGAVQGKVHVQQRPVQVCVRQNDDGYGMSRRSVGWRQLPVHQGESESATEGHQKVMAGGVVCSLPKRLEG
jgi:hypothetical protein